MIPIADSPRPLGLRPWVTWALMAVNILVAMITLPLGFVDWPPSSPGWAQLPQNAPPEVLAEASGLTWVVYTFGFRPNAPGLFTTLTSMFLHGGLLHLFGNMLYLWIYGPNLEHRLGRVPFVLLYLTAGMLGDMLYALVSLGSGIPVVGASGAISGLLGAYLILFPLNTVRVLLLFVTTFELPAWPVLAFFVLVDNLWPFLTTQGSGVAHSAHLGGFFAGAMLAVGLRALGASNPQRRRTRRLNRLGHARALYAQGMLLDAHQELTQILETVGGEEAEDARAELARIEADPAYQRAMGHR